MTPVTAPADTRLSRYAPFLKGEPKALGTVQIMIGCMTFMFGTILTSLALTPTIISGITLWGSLIYISSGALSVAAVNHQTSCLVKASLGMNIFSAVVAGLSLILFSLDMVLGSFFIPWCSNYSSYYNHDRYNHDRYNYDLYNYVHYDPDSNFRCKNTTLSLWNGIYGVLLVFAVLEFIISICTSVFGCKVTCCTETTPMYPQPLTTQVMYTPAFNPQYPPQPSAVAFHSV